MEERGRGKRNMHSEKNKDERDRQLEAMTNISVRCEGREGCAGKKGSAGRSWRFWAPQQ